MKDGKVVEYDVSLSKRDGIITCSCPDAQYRGKTGNVMRLDKPHRCKHVSKLCHTLGAVLAPPLAVADPSIVGDVAAIGEEERE